MSFGCVDWVNFGIEVKGARGVLGLSREALARATNLAPATITRIEEGGSDVGTKNAGVVLQSFLERSGIEFPKGTLGVAIAFNDPNKMKEGIAVTADPSMPSGSRFLWGN